MTPRRRWRKDRWFTRFCTRRTDFRQSFEQYFSLPRGSNVLLQFGRAHFTMDYASGLGTWARKPFS